MLLRIVEQDQDYIKGLREYLISMAKAKATDEMTIIEVADNFDPSVFHGLEKASTAKPFAVEFAPVCDWLNNYNGTFPFYLSLKSQLASKGYLSPAQIACVVKAIGRDTTRKMAVQAPAMAAKTFSLGIGDIIVVSKWLARKIGEQAGLARAHYTLEVVAVEAETERAYKATLKLSGQRTSRCGICGIKLTDPHSVANGIGPICAEKVGIAYSGQSLAELQTALKEVRTVNTWLPKSSIKEKIPNKKLT